MCGFLPRYFGADDFCFAEGNGGVADDLILLMPFTHQQDHISLARGAHGVQNGLFSVDDDGSSEATGLSDGDGSVDGNGSSDALGSFVGSADTDGSSEAPDSSDGLSAEVKFSEFSSPQKNNAVGFSYCFGI